MFAFYQEEPVIRYIYYLFPLALSISSASSLASVIAILMTAMINAKPISPATPNISFHHMSFIILMFNTAFGRFQRQGTSASEANKSQEIFVIMNTLMYFCKYETRNTTHFILHCCYRSLADSIDM